MLADLRLALRSLRGAPGFALVAVLCLALGIGVNTAVFAMVNALLVRPLPFAEPARTVMVYTARPRHGVDERNLSVQEFEAVRSGARSLETAGGMLGQQVNLAGAFETERVRGERVTHEVLPMLGVRPTQGRLFTRDDDRPGAPKVVILSHGLWQRRFDGRPGIVGEKVTLDGVPHTVVGVMPPRFRFPMVQELWLPLALDATTAQRDDRYVWTIGRLRPGATLAQLQDEMRALGGRLAAAHPATNAGWEVHAKPLAEEFVEGPLRQMTVLMLGAVGFVLLIACANVANLYFARAMGRRRELAVRAALGASRWRLARQQFVEGLVLAAAGGALGIGLAAAWNRHLLASIPEELPYWVRIEIDPVVVAYTVGVAVLAAVLFGMLPALRTSGVPPQAALSDGGRTASVGRGARRASGLLVTTQVSLAVVLLVGASLLVRSAMAVARADVGTDDAHLLTARTRLDGERYRGVARRADHFARAVEALAALPGVRAASATTALPTDDEGEGVAIVAEGRSTAPGDEIMGIAVGSLPGLFDALGAPLVAGRDFTAREAADTLAAVAIVNRALAERLWPDAPALGRRVRVQPSGGEATWVTVVGVAPDLMYGEFGEQESTQRLQVHLPYARLGWRAMSLVVRATGEPVALAAPARRAIAALDPLVPVFDVLTMREVRRVTTYPYRLWGEAFGMFGVLAVTLAALGVYGVMATTVAQRRREIGVRLALGARAGQVLRGLARQGARLALPGAVVGVVAALGMARLLAGMLYGVSTTDVTTFLLGPLALVGVATLASWLPARRAARVDPAIVLRAE